MEQLIVNSLGREKRYARLNNDVLEKLVIEQPAMQSMVGNIYFGTVEKVLPGMNAAFIDIGQEKSGYLHRDKLSSFLVTKEDKSISSYLHQGEKLLVQVEKDPTGNKGPRLTGIIELNGEFLVYMPKGRQVAVSKKIESSEVRERWRQFGNQVKSEDEGFLFRTNSVERTEDEALIDLQRLREKYDQLLTVTKGMKKPGLLYEKNSFLAEVTEIMKQMKAGVVVVDQLDWKKELALLNQNPDIEVVYHQAKENIFSTYRVEHEIEKALNSVVPLENGAYLVFDEAEALTIIDVNTGKFSGKNQLKDTVLKTNELAAEEIARQIRIRDLAGIILIDFIDMVDLKAREQVKRKLENVLRKDERRTRMVGFTPLGILQLTRMKTRVSISESLMTSCNTCEGLGKVLSPDSVAYQMERELLEQRGKDEEAILIETTDEVRNIFSGESSIHQKTMEEIIGMKIFFTIQEAPKPYYLIRQLGIIKDLEQKTN
ncbi:Rne/Rng family ribonuclease [Robertmurraya yapensis]|uniref:Rne/Rng family ribonuclease n=1 Tax=Bacillus yapensis TaxID=2492960 RepID=A0A3S0RST6_9BACI|nr:Rne/Rng family ribonuclease [Bacillus yapensis]RTR35454.1 Rne/Rng family ribonuclease [Bacillus yapensis]TKS97963.1 Rne/Rng family ribonuclease [Bacillus yapensis]